MGCTLSIASLAIVDGTPLADLVRFLTKREYAAGSTVRIDTERWMREVRRKHYTERDASAAFFEMRDLVRSLPYDDSNGWVSRRELRDYTQRRWFVLMMNLNGKWWLLASHPRNPGGERF